MTKSSDAWDQLFTRFNILENVKKNGYFDISADEIKSLHYEPRLLTKVDHSIHLPEIMNKNDLSILTLSNAKWRIGPFDIFQKLPKWEFPDSSVNHKSLPNWLHSLNKNSITGEGALLNAADASGMLTDFCGEELTATVSGKGRSGAFNFSVNNKSSGLSKIEVQSAQIEIDAGYEGPSALYLFEAKKHISIDFNVRQLYYPYRTWLNRVKKPVKPIFITLANDVFDLTEFSFRDPNNFSSIELVRTKRYMLTDDEIDSKEIIKFAREADFGGYKNTNAKSPFPQANDFERVIDLLEFVATGAKSIDEITENYEFSSRQSDYYFSALRYLGLGEVVDFGENKASRKLTSLGEAIAGKSFVQKRLELAKLMMEIPALRKMYLIRIETGELPDTHESAKIVEEYSDREGISGDTIPRRAQTIRAWVKWLTEISE